MSCEHCKQIQVKIKIPKDLRRAISLAVDRTDDGTLSYLGAGVMGDPFQSIANGSGWSDFVSNYFKSNACEQLFHLHAETYHGSGGSLERVAQIEGELQPDTFKP